MSLNRLVPHKRIDLLLRAWNLAAAFVPGKLVIVGDGPEIDAIREQARLIPRVRSRRTRAREQEKTELLSRSWAVVSTAHHEGWGLSIMEAAAHGTPALAFDVPGAQGCSR